MRLAVLCAAGRSAARIAAENERPLADNSWRKQQKQQEDTYED
jgi:hypothetical protein